MDALCYYIQQIYSYVDLFTLCDIYFKVGDYMNIIEAKKRLRKVLRYPYLNSYNQDFCKKILEELRISNDDDYYCLLGTFLIFEKKYEESKNAFNKDLEKGANYSSYYGLYRIALYENDYESAYKYALLCNEKKNASGVDFSLQAGLARKTLKVSTGENALDDTITLDKDVFFEFSVNRFYSKAVAAFNNNDMFGVRENIINICENCDTKEIPFDFYEMMNSIDSLIFLQRDAYFNSVDEGKSNKFSTREALNYINMTIYSDVDKASEIYEKEKDRLKENTNPLFINYIEKKILERKIFISLEKNQARFYKYSINQVKTAINNGNFDNALLFCDNGLDITRCAVFSYYKGKALYFLGRYDEAIESFKKYLESGSSKFTGAMQYLKMSYEVLGNDEDVIKTGNDYETFINYFINLSESTKNKGISTSKKESSNNYSKTGHVKINIKSLVSDDLTLADYDKYCFKQKIGVVAGLYGFKSSVKKADKLIGQLEKSAKTIEEKELVKVIKTNKKLLMSRGGKK